MIQFNSRFCIKLDDLWQALYLSFNSVHNYYINIDILDKIPLKSISKWRPFLKEEFKNTISKCNDLLAPGINKISWKILKQIINNLTSIINITNFYINLRYWPSYFKLSTSIIIPKLNKLSYNSYKFFHSIMLLNMLSKLIEKVIRERMQFHTISNNFVHSYQFRRLKKMIYL